MKNFIKKIAIISIILTLFSCSSQKSWVYKTNNIEVGSKFKNKTVAVLPFRDNRINENKDRLLLYMVPLMPYGWQDLEIPESKPMHMNSGKWENYDPKKDFAEALALDLEENNIFKESYVTKRAKNANYKIIGHIISTKYDAKLYSYGLSVYGPLLHFFGFPATKVENSITLKLSLVDAKRNKTIFSKKYYSPLYEKTSVIYNLKSDFYYSDLLRIIYKRFINDISEL